MTSRIALGALLLGAALFVAPPGGGTAHAQGACQPVDPRLAAQARLPSLQFFLGAIRQMTGGQMPIGSQLCQIGGRLVYRVQVIVNGQHRWLTIDPASGAIN